MKAVFLTDESRALPNDPEGLTKGRIFNGTSDNCSVGTPRQQSHSVVMIWGGMIQNELTDLFRVPEELKLTTGVYCSFLKKSIEAWHCNLLLFQWYDCV